MELLFIWYLKKKKASNKENSRNSNTKNRSLFWQYLAKTALFAQFLSNFPLIIPTQKVGLLLLPTRGKIANQLKIAILPK